MGILPYLTRLKKICFSAVKLMHVYAPVLNACKRISPAVKTRFEQVEACFIGTVNTLHAQRNPFKTHWIKKKRIFTAFATRSSYVKSHLPTQPLPLTIWPCLSSLVFIKQRGTRECIAYNLSIVLRLDKNKTSKNFKKSTDYQLRNKWMKDTLDSELNSRAVGAVYRRRKMQDHKRAIQWLSFRHIAHTMHFSALFPIPIL